MCKTYANICKIQAHQTKEKNTSVQDVVPKLGEILATMENGRSGDRSGYPRSRASVAETNGTPRKSTARKWDDTEGPSTFPCLAETARIMAAWAPLVLERQQDFGTALQALFKYNVYKYKISFLLTRFMWIYTDFLLAKNLRSSFTRSPPWTPSCSCWALGAAGESERENSQKSRWSWRRGRFLRWYWGRVKSYCFILLFIMYILYDIIQYSIWANQEIFPQPELRCFSFA